MLDSLQELRRRRVFRAAASYAVVGWLVLQAAEILFEPFNVPDSVFRGLVIAVLVGFAITVVVSWLFDVHRSGVQRTRSHGGMTLTRWVEFTMLALLIAGVTYIGYLAFRPGVSSQAPVTDDLSIAVLPFVNMSGDPENEYFSDGISEELLNVLVKIDQLRVAARTSSFAYKGRNENVQHIGRDLNVSTVLEGSVRRNKDQVRITAQLINTADGYHLWSETYDRELTDIFQVQDEISAAIVDALKMTLLGSEKAAMEQRPTDSVDAYQLYLQGRYYWHQRTAESIQRAVGHFTRAIELDPEFTRAYTGLADAYMLLVDYGNMSINDARPKARELTEKALALNPQSAEAHASMGLILNSEGRFEEAMAAYERALSFDPDYAVAYIWYGNTLGTMQRDAEQLQAYEQAFELEPLLYPANSNLSWQYVRRGRYLDAVTPFSNLARIRPESASYYHAQVGSMYVKAGNHSEAVRWYQRALQDDPLNVMAMAELGNLYRELGLLELAGEWHRYALSIDTINLQASLNASFLALEQREFQQAWMIIDGMSQLYESPVPSLELYRVLLAILADDEQREAGVRQRYHEYFGPQYQADSNAVLIALYLAAVEMEQGHESLAFDLLNQIETMLKESRRSEIMQAWQWYALAGVRALRGQSQEALDAFDTAIDGGWRDTFSLRSESSSPFVSLLQNSRYLTLLERIDNLNQQQRERVQRLPVNEIAPRPERQQPPPSASELEAISGFYQVNNDTLDAVTVRNQRLVLKRQALVPLELQPLGNNRYAVRNSSLRLQFIQDDSSRYTHLLSRWNGLEIRQKRINYIPPQEVQIDPQLFDRLTGTYELGGPDPITIVRRGDYLFLESNDQLAQLYAEDEWHFFLKINDTRLAFHPDEDGSVNRVTLTNREARIEAVRVDDESR
ncbi:MAG: hypothetical protein Tsb002_05890 [Wenzhouxiangellaceae bacterium]